MSIANTQNTESIPSLSEKQISKLETTQSMAKMIFVQFLEHRLAVIGAIIILLFVATALFADVISNLTGLDPDGQNVAARYLPPFTYGEVGADLKESSVDSWIKSHPSEAGIIQKALVEKQVVTVAENDSIFELSAKEKTEAIEKLKSLALPETKDLERLLGSFSQYHVFGTDEIGRDVFIRIIYGTRVSMGVGVMVALFSALIGLLVGSLAGYYGGLIDMVLMRVTDALLSLPTVPVLIIFAAVDLQKLPVLKSFLTAGSESIFKLVVIMLIFSWMPIARLVRGSILSLREREFVLAAKTLGAKDSTIIIRHMFPSVLAPMLVSITLGVGESILYEAALSYLGLGIVPPTPSWGNMLNNAQETIYKNLWLAVIPGIMIVLTTISFNFVGDGLQDAVDPKSVRR